MQLPWQMLFNITKHILLMVLNHGISLDPNTQNFSNHMSSLLHPPDSTELLKIINK